MFQIAGCVSDKADRQNGLASYQEMLSDQGPQRRADTRGRNRQRPLDLLRPGPSAATPGVATATDPNTGERTVLGVRSTKKKRTEPIPSPTQDMPAIVVTSDPNTGASIVNLTIEQTLTRALANSPEIRVVSFDPSIAKQDITRAASEFDMTAFLNLNYEDEDNPANSIFLPGESEVQTWDSGIKQKGISGLEWSLSYGLMRSWDDLVGRTLPTRYEPMLSFKLKQPLLRDAGEDFALAGVNVAKLNYRMAFFGFRDKAEETAAQAISAYWRLLQARQDMEIQQSLLDRTLETLSKVEGRREIDATDVQVKQTEASTKAREAALLQAKKAVSDAQDTLLRLMADRQLNVLSDFELVPASQPALQAESLDQNKVLKLAMENNPVLQQARLGVDIADINVRSARNQHMPRLDLMASARAQGLARGRNAAQDVLEDRDYVSYAVGISLEIPLGNRQRDAELLKRRLERRQAIAALQNVADQVAIAAKEASRKIETTYSEIQVQKEATEAASIHLQALEDSEPVRERLTPEFLLVKLQAQEALAIAQRAEIRAVVDFNIAMAQLARVLGTVFELRQVGASLPTLIDQADSGGRPSMFFAGNRSF